jgi:hypothetical protein
MILFSSLCFSFSEWKGSRVSFRIRDMGLEEVSGCLWEVMVVGLDLLLARRETLWV